MSSVNASAGESPIVDPRLPAFLEAHGLIPARTQSRWTPLAGGVSSEIWRVECGGVTLCVKRALARLRVAQEWHAPVSRNDYEWAWLSFAHARCPGNVPAPLAHDPQLGALAMQYLDPEHHPVWKQQLLAGATDVSLAAAVGALLGTLHAASAGDPELARRFASDDIFHAIRLEPYLLATAMRHDDLREHLTALAARTARTKLALVHGDVSPKNILVGNAGPVLIDAECAWYGDPAFDLAFCLNHLLLKSVARPDLRVAYRACFDALAHAYLHRVAWEPAEALEGRTATLLPALFLARVDGKSPVEYLHDESQRGLVRASARMLLSKPVGNLRTVAAVVNDALQSA